MSTHKLSPLNLVNARLGIGFILAMVLMFASAGRTLADPVESPLRVFCFRITDIERVAGDPGNDKFRIEFEVLDWSSGSAFGVYIALNEGNGIGAVGGDPAPFFAGAEVDSDGRPLVLLDVNGNGIINAADLEDANRNGLLDPGEDKNNNGRLDNDPIPGNQNPPNDWSVASATATAIRWGAGTPVSSIDLNRFPNGPPVIPGDPEIAFMRFTNPADPATVITETIDNGPNVRDGFIITVDDFDPGEILSFNWFLTDANGNIINVEIEGPGTEVNDPYAYGVVNFASLAAGGALPGPVFVGNTGFSQSPLMFFDSVYVVPNPASFAAEFGAAITATFLDQADNLFNIPVTTHLAITVNTTDDELNSDGDCSLREAITAANTDAAVDACIAGSGADTIGFSVTGAITLGSTLPNIIDHLTLIGPGAANLTLSGNNAVGVLIVNTGIGLNLRGLTIANGSSGGIPGGIWNNGGTLTVAESTISNNVGLDGAGIYNSAGTVEIVNSTLSGNMADYYGGGIYNSNNGTVTIRNSTLANNSTSPFFTGWGGGIYNLGTLIVAHSTLSGNSVTCFGCIGGGIYNSGSATITNSTLSGNSARDGGGLWNQRGSAVTIVNSTFFNNRAGIAGFGSAISNNAGGAATLRNTIIANNSNVANCYGGVFDLGHNLEFPFRSCSGSILIADPLLGPLQNNGGPTLTHALLSGSPAIDAVPLADCPAVAADQRGVARPQSLACDIGAFELTTQLIVIKQVVNDNGGTAGAGDFTMSVTGAAPFPGDEAGTTVTLNAGDYSVSESDVAGYRQISASADCSGAITVGETRTCTITNDDMPPKLIVIKQVINDNGGAAVAGDFTMTVIGGGPNPPSFPGNEAGTTVTLNAGDDYSVSETGPTGYAMSLSADCSGTIAAGETRICTVTNDDIAPTLLVIKHVINDNGGTAVAADFTMTVSGANLIVNSTADLPDSSPGDGLCQAPVSGVCTLRAAVMEANANIGPDAIHIPAGTYLLTIPPGDSFEQNDFEGDLDIKDHLILLGDGAETTIVDASSLGDRVFEVVGGRFNPDPLQAEMLGLTLRGGSTPLIGGCVLHIGNGTLTIKNAVIKECSAPNSAGGGIYHDGTGQVGRVVLVDSVVSDNLASFGGGINTGNGELELIRTVVTRNRALGPVQFSVQWGGGIDVPLGKMTAIDSDISHNVAGRKGGGIVASQAQITLLRTTVSNNEVLNAAGVVGFGEGTGGGIWIERVNLILTNSTISNNKAANDGGGIYSDREGAFQIAFSTITQNSNLSGSGAAGLRMIDPPSRPRPRIQTFKGTIVAGNTSSGGAVDCGIDTPAASLGDNLDGAASCGFTNSTDQSNVTVGLESLAANGGVGGTHALQSGSPAMDAIPGAQCSFMLDNDIDGQIDEDPIDGLDNDGDFRVDEDPLEPALTDQRGTPRPQGSGCDIGAFEVGPAPGMTGSNVSPASFPGDEAGTIVTLNAGQYRVSESGPGGYIASFSADCSGTIAIGETKTCTVTNDDIARLPPDLVIEKSDGRDTAQAGDTLTYTLTISNVGGQTATGVIVTDTLPPQTTFVSASDGGSRSGGLVAWPTFNLAAGANVTRTLTVRVNDDLNSAPVRDTRTWTRGSIAITFSTPEHYSGCGSATIAAITNTATVADDGAHGLDPTPEDNTASDTDSVTGSEVIWTTGVPNNWSLLGWVRVQYVMDTQRILVREYQISQTGDLDLRVSYPPVREWPVMSNGVALIHVELSISVYDARGELVRWVGGDQRRAPGTLGPGGQDWGVWCRVSNLRN